MPQEDSSHGGARVPDRPGKQCSLRCNLRSLVAQAPRADAGCRIWGRVVSCESIAVFPTKKV